MAKFAEGRGVHKEACTNRKVAAVIKRVESRLINECLHKVRRLRPGTPSLALSLPCECPLQGRFAEGKGKGIDMEEEKDVEIDCTD
jgi:hypothetical protein